jgi:phosphoglycolate phosphatase
MCDVLFRLFSCRILDTMFRKRKAARPPKPPVVLFDFDGVIADSLDVFHPVFATMCAELGYASLAPREAFLKLFEGNAILRLMRHGFTLRKLRQFGEQFRPLIEEANARVPVFDGMPQVFNDLAARFPLYVVTSNSSEAIRDFLARHNMTGTLDILGADHEVSKVKKIKTVVKRHRDCQPYYIGDTKGDMREARRAGAVAVAVAWGWHTVDKLKEGRPAHIVESPQALRDLFLSLAAPTYRGDCFVEDSSR